MKLSRSLRMFALLGLVVIGIALLHFQPLATILPIVFPSIVVKCLQIIELKKASAVKGGKGL